jgi:hypothetical protein
MGTASKLNCVIGFLTVVEHSEHGLFGGYLVLNRAGRPLEFHCTAPVKASRAQQILYGPTLQPYLYGEQIGQTLLSKSKAQPLAVCTDCEPALAVREFTETPVTLVFPGGDGGGEEASPPAERPSNGRTHRLDSAHGGSAVGPCFALGRNRLAVSRTTPADQEEIRRRLAEVADSWDLAEPFERIREAIEEARKGGQ